MQNSDPIVIPGEPVAKPRQTRSDKWKQRPCVMRYRAWADEARRRAGRLPPDVHAVSCAFYMEMPKSWSTKRRLMMRGALHRVRPDADNLLKSLLDSLWPQNDAGLCDVAASKRWDDGKGARTEVAFGD